MSLVNIIQVTVLDNPTAFTNPFQFEITFECLQELQDDLEWKVIYVGDAEDAAADQVLEEVMVGPVPVGINKFVLQAVAPNHSVIADQNLIGVTVVLVTCSFMEQEFIRIGYYVNNEYLDYDPENPPNPIEITKLYRSIRHDEPRVTRFAIDWTGVGGADMLSQTSSDETDVERSHNDEIEDLMPGDEDDMEDDEDEEDEEDDEDEVDLEDDEDADEYDEEDQMVISNEDSMDVLQMQNQGSDVNSITHNFH